MVAWGAMIKETLEAAEQLAAENVEAEVIDEALDSATILASVARTGRLVIVHEAPIKCGYECPVSLAPKLAYDAELRARIVGSSAPRVMAYA